MGNARKVPPGRPPIAIAAAESMLLTNGHLVLAGLSLSMLSFGRTASSGRATPVLFGLLDFIRSDTMACFNKHGFCSLSVTEKRQRLEPVTGSVSFSVAIQKRTRPDSFLTVLMANKPQRGCLTDWSNR